MTNVPACLISCVLTKEATYHSLRVSAALRRRSKNPPPPYAPPECEHGARRYHGLFCEWPCLPIHKGWVRSSTLPIAYLVGCVRLKKLSLLGNERSFAPQEPPPLRAPREQARGTELSLRSTSGGGSPAVQSCTHLQGATAYFCRRYMPIV